MKRKYKIYFLVDDEADFYVETTMVYNEADARNHIKVKYRNHKLTILEVNCIYE